MENRIIIANKQQKYDLEHLKHETKEILNSFDNNCYLLDDLKAKCDLSNLFLRTTEGNEICEIANGTKLENLNKDKNYFLVKSKILTNCYYPMEQYEEFYKADLEKTIKILASFMGAKEVIIECEKEFIQKTSSHTGVNQEIKVKSNVKNMDVDINYRANGGYKTEQNSYEQNQNKSSLKSNESITIKKTKEELKEWIDKNYINKDALPDFFQAILTIYLDNGHITGEHSNTQVDKIKENVIKEFTLFSDLKAKINNLPYNIGTSLGFNNTKETDHEKKYYINYYIKF